MFGDAGTEVGFHRMRAHSAREPRSSHRADSPLSLCVVTPMDKRKLLSIVDHTFAEVRGVSGLRVSSSLGVAWRPISVNGVRTTVEGHVDAGIGQVFDLYCGHQVEWEFSLGAFHSAQCAVHGRADLHELGV